jgi:hypothetical protein
MTDRSTFTTEEWETLYLTPLHVAGTVAVAGASGFTGTAKEAYAIVTVPAEAAHTYPNNTLLAALTNRDNSPAIQDLETEERPHNVTDMKLRAFDGIQKSLAILNTKATPEEVQQYRRWLYAVAEGIAKAAKEGSLLGFGGERISAEEQEILDAFQQELGLSGAAVPIREAD